MLMRPNRQTKVPRLLRRTRVLKKGGTWVGYYYNGRDAEGNRIEIPLGADLQKAKLKWAELEGCAAPTNTKLLRFIFDRYARDVMPLKAPKTQKDNAGSLAMLRKVFDVADIDTVTPQHIAQYRDRRKDKQGRLAPVRANREIALFSHVWNLAREWGYTAKENPVRGVRKNKETPRDYYADAQVWDAVYAQACIELQDAMDLNYLTGQRPADVLKMRLADIKDGALEVQQNKTRKKLRILLDDNGVRTELGRVIDRIRTRDGKVASMFLIATAKGAALNRGTLRLRFDAARAAAAKAAKQAGDDALTARIVNFQFRDIRPKAASELPLAHASKLLGHTEHEITEKVYRRVGEVVKPTK